MNFFVISPNVWNDGDVMPHVTYMARNHLVCMGWDKDRQNGWAFAHKIKNGDGIIVAQRKNWHWTIYFAGIVDSSARYGDERGRHYTMCRDLRAFVDLERTGTIEFAAGMTGYSKKNPGALFQLHKENLHDAKFMDSMEKLLRQVDGSLSFAIREIANWRENGRVAIPSLQRGLVWSPKQVELLWDSMLRGFPIGAFVFLDATKESKQRTSETLNDAQYFLLDGQQRANAISLAFERVPQATRLWVDLLPELPSTRRFMVKATTKAHPWGYKNDNDSSILSAQEIRNAICKFTGIQSGEITKFDVSELDPMTDTKQGTWATWPITAKCPIPLHCILSFFDFHGYDIQEFKHAIIEWLNSDKNISGRHPTTEDEAKLNEEIQKWYRALQGLTEYRIHANLLPQRTIDAEAGDAQVDEVSNLESLFTRLNTMGSRISPYDLRYSAIKAYWGGIKEENDKIAQTIMPGANLAIFAFRLALTVAAETFKSPESRARLADVPSILRIRKIGIGTSLEKLEEHARSILLDELYKGRLKQIIDSIEGALGVFKRATGNVNGLPPFLRTAIVTNSPDVYLFLMILAYHNTLEAFNPGTLCALSTYIHWMCIDSKKNVVDELFNNLLSNGFSEENLRKAVREQVGTNLFPLEKLILNLNEEGNRSTHWTQPQHDRFYARLAYNMELLIFAERCYFNRNFKYDPAQMDVNKGHNKPWDYDHIVPKEWTWNKKTGPYRHICKEWTWTIGNYAAIPFAINRRKSNKEDWDEYLENAEELLFEPAVSQITRRFLYEYDNASLFWHITAARMERIYSSWRDFVVQNLGLPDNLEIQEMAEEES